jgi:hypothetical protein
MLPSRALFTVDSFPKLQNNNQFWNKLITFRLEPSNFFFVILLSVADKPLMLNVIQLSVIMLSVILLNVIYAECRK